ncbi:hypothetical protein GLAREA_12002 [Glarea lozoyensis ATCC 20868]|uniref:Uncharacterized protein n=1 Tax=Glarea lozoyensis (strain ATCC 20868 / MF5171) TaxID=1116229 RepID=S3D277_GLAL2|nr:uncharacterized protein GLAREA_12002 [Glarea lozoyensis ATCC 20868]EPE31920.1 hypothetical protein GLAREA_12002 [Glarea lozoyensis ATCC 20868]
MHITALILTFATFILSATAGPVAIAALSSELANRGLDELHCCKDNGRGWQYAPYAEFQTAYNRFRGPGTIFVPHGCTAVTGCNNGAETLVCNDHQRVAMVELSTFAQFFDTVAGQCVSWETGVPSVCGQAFNNEHRYNLVLKKCNY